MGKDTGRCINCGFLGKRRMDRAVAGCYEALPVDRETGKFQPIQGHGLYPCCFRNKTEYTWDVSQGQHPVDCLVQMSEDRKCQYWYPYTEHRTPEQHFEEFQMLQLEDNRRQFEQQMEKDRREFDLKLFEMSQKIQSDSKEIVTKSDRFNRRITIFIIILAILEVAGTLLALFFPDGFWWLGG